MVAAQRPYFIGEQLPELGGGLGHVTGSAHPVGEVVPYGEGVEMNGALQVLVEDDGVGLPEHFRAGGGIASMRERAAELGGTCSVSRREPSGTSVRAVLPVTVTP